jgi:hypothetical protein
LGVSSKPAKIARRLSEVSALARSKEAAQAPTRQTKLIKKILGFQGKNKKASIF